VLIAPVKGVVCKTVGFLHKGHPDGTQARIWGRRAACHRNRAGLDTINLENAHRHPGVKADYANTTTVLATGALSFWLQVLYFSLAPLLGLPDQAYRLNKAAEKASNEEKDGGRGDDKKQPASGIDYGSQVVAGGSEAAASHDGWPGPDPGGDRQLVPI
jgi:hypothetical protein